MSMGSWFRIHGKQIITHTLIIVGFVLFTIFVTGPLFDRLESIPGEAQLQQLQLPADTNNIRFNIDEITIQTHIIFCWGWAFIEGHDVDLASSKTYIVLKSDKHIYIFDTGPRERPNVTKIFGAGKLNLDWAGFVTNIPVRKIDRGSYIVGLYITRGDMEALQYTGMIIEL